MEAKRFALWDVASRKDEGQASAGHSNWVNSVAFSPDGTLLASGTQDGTELCFGIFSAGRR